MCVLRVLRVCESRSVKRDTSVHTSYLREHRVSSVNTDVLTPPPSHLPSILAAPAPLRPQYDSMTM